MQRVERDDILSVLIAVILGSKFSDTERDLLAGQLGWAGQILTFFHGND